MPNAPTSINRALLQLIINIQSGFIFLVFLPIFLFIVYRKRMRIELFDLCNLG
jgi:hypothetical protein